MSSATAIGQRILLTLWVGGLWTVGYIAVPMLFHALDDRRLAGELAGRLFGVINGLGLVCGLLLLASVLYQSGREWRRTWQVWVLLAMLAMISIGEFGLAPLMQALKAANPQGFIQGTSDASRFGMLHGISSLLYLAISLMGFALVVFGLGRNNAPSSQP
ncbi:MAG: DUF4149 domain-containing protein [Proteobacteria bacterium]|nr:DUF4149 domain-containing protein [Pseudomonadota bacterium]